VKNDRQVQHAVVAIVRGLVDELGGSRDAVGLDDALDRDLGIGSLERVELLLRIEKGLGVRLADDVIEEAATARDLVAAVASAEPRVAEALGPAVAAPAGAGAAPDSAATLVQALEWHATAHPDRVHIRLAGPDDAFEPITYGQLWQGGSRLAMGLRERGLAAGETVALMLRTEAAFFDAFFGVLLAGGIPVPIYPPFRRDRLEEYAHRQAGILNNAQARMLVTFPEALGLARLIRPHVRSLRHIESAERLTRTVATTPHHARGGDAALIQYTSGSTGEPKGVLLSHANVLANIRAIGQAIAIRPEDIAVSWLPLYHDMGLIGSWLGALYFGIPIVLLSPMAFLARPARWLRLIHAHRATISAAPNFAFDLCARRVPDDELGGLDLSTWRLALNGSEPVSPETIERFTRRFAPYGFTSAALCPVYGLAEASVALTMPPPGREPRVDTIARERFEQHGEAIPLTTAGPSPLSFVSCGRPLSGHDVRILDAAGRPLGDRRQGRIEFRGPSVTSGYFRNAAATAAALHDGWLDSGDLGYWAEGELFITGRCKDMIIKAGRNLYPQEIEAVVGGTPGVRRGCVAALGVPDGETGTERLVVIAESREQEPSARQRLEAHVRDRVMGALGIPADTVVLAAPGSVLKTSSGKIRRGATRAAYLAGTLQARRSGAAQLMRLLAASVGARAADVRRWMCDAGLALYLASLVLPCVATLWIALLLSPTARAADRVTKRWCRAMLALVGCAVRVEGNRGASSGASVIFAANHASYLDVVVLLAALTSDVHFVAKRELLRTPVVGTAIRKAGHVTVERGRGSRSVADAERITAALARSQSVLVFPEGTFRASPGVLPFRLGAFKAAVETRREVVPIAIRGTRGILPAGRWLPRPGPVTVVIGEPVVPRGQGWPAIVRLRDETRAWISERTGEGLVDEAQLASLRAAAA
jgi:1-acyl-sn-glycerol-3-phosphate acyltransferase